jgi:hypothetical protein
MRGDVVELARAVPRFRQHLAAAHEHGAHRHLAALPRRFRLGEGGRHVIRAALHLASPKRLW